MVLAGEHDLSSAADVEQAVEQSLTACGQLIVDLSAVEFIDSSTIAVLVQAMKNATALGRRFNLVLGTKPIVEWLVDITGARPLLNVVPTVEEALTVRADVAPV